MSRVVLHVFIMFIAGLVTCTKAVAAFPEFDPQSQCPQAEPHRSPDGFIFKSCSTSKTIFATTGTRQEISHVLERFFDNGHLDMSWGTLGRVTVLAGIEGQSPCNGIAPDRTIFFAPGGRILLYQPSSSRLRAFQPNGTDDLNYGINGTSVRLCDYFSPLLSLDMLPNGEFIATSGFSLVADGTGTLEVQRISAAGVAVEGYGFNGRVKYAALPFSAGQADGRMLAKAWSLQEDGSLQVSYLHYRHGQGASGSRLLVKSQAQAAADSTTMPARILPQRGLVFYLTDARTRERDLSGRISVHDTGLQTQYLATGGALIFDSNRQRDGGERYVVRYTATGAVDFAYGESGQVKIALPSVNGCELYSAAERAYLQGDGSIVYIADYAYTSGFRWHLPCPAKSSESIAVKLLANGQLDPAFPQYRDPAKSGAKFTTESPKWTAVEYYSPKLDRYFFTPHSEEADYIDLDVGLRAQGWWRTGKTFGVWNPDSELPGTASACRFAADPIIPPRSFYDSILDKECNILREQELATPPDQRAWRYDRESFRATPAANGVCPSSLIPIYSLYNQGHERGIDSNFRYVDNLTDFNAMIDRGWVGLAQPQFCARPD